MSPEGADFDAFVSNADVNRYNLEDIRVPTLIVHTKDDPLASHEASRRAAERIPGARFVSLESGAHLMLGQAKIIRNERRPSPHHEAHDGYLARYLATGDRKIIGIGREVVGRRRDGTTFPLHLSIGEMIVGTERKFTGILHDLTARASLETQLREQAALVKLGEMAAVLAHEVKNPLAGIRGAVQVIGGRFPSDSRDATIMKEIVTRIDGLNDLMKDLLLYARPPQPRPTPVDVAGVVTATADLLKADPAVSRVHVTLDGSAPTILADPELLKIVFVNLLVNGAHAMRGEGRIRVSVTSTNGTCDVAFRDDGPGIPLEIREKIAAAPVLMVTMFVTFRWLTVQWGFPVAT